MDFKSAAEFKTLYMYQYGADYEILVNIAIGLWLVPKASIS